MFKTKGFKSFVSLFVALLLLCQTVPVWAGENYTNHWASQSIDLLLSKGIITGDRQGNINPDNLITRAEFVTVVNKTFGYSEASSSNFPDVKEGKWYYNQFALAKQAGIITGDRQGYAHPDDYVTRAEVAVILANALQLQTSKSASTFTDNQSIPAWALKSVIAMQEHNLLGGYPDGSVRAGKNLTRAEGFTIIANVLQSDLLKSTATPENSTPGDEPVTKAPATPAATQTVSANRASSGGSGGGSGGGDSATYRLTVTADVYGTVTSGNGGNYAAGAVVTIAAAPNFGYGFNGWTSSNGGTFANAGAAATTFTMPAADTTLTATFIKDDASYTLPSGVVDYGDIENLIALGRVEVLQNDAGLFRVIDGTFTSQTVNSAADAAAVLNNAASLLGRNFYADPANITVQSTADGTSYYRYSPEVNGVPVLGSQVILTVDGNGTVTGLFGTYDNRINSVYTTPAITAEAAIDIALNDYLASPAVQNLLDSLAGELALNRNDVETAFRDELATNAQLLVYAVDSGQAPVLVWAVELNSVMDENDKDNGDWTNDALADDTNGELSGLPIELESADDPPSVLEPAIPLVSHTYYIYANGAMAGGVLTQISNLQTANGNDLRPVTVKAQDELGKTRTIGLLYNPSLDMYGFHDKNRKLLTYRALYTRLPSGKLKIDLPGDLVKSESGKRILDKEAVGLHANMSASYDYYNTLGWESFDGHGARRIVSSINAAAEDDVNKYTAWDPSSQQMVFTSSRKDSNALDVVGHEFTHAVISYIVGAYPLREINPFGDPLFNYALTINVPTTGLFYKGETGALDEAYADIMGSLIENKDKASAARWSIGEDSDHGVYRNMSNPAQFGQPDNYSALTDQTWIERLNTKYPAEKDGSHDNGGVHFFSSVYSLAAYKMMTDSRTNSIPDATWTKVFYWSLFRLSSNALFLDGRKAVVASAKIVGFTKEQQQAIKDAFDAVGIVDDENIRIILRWGASPKDLDSHLTGPSATGSGGGFHIYYAAREFYDDGNYYSSTAKLVADLDHDETNSFGPEITTIRKLIPGDYYFYVHDYTNRDEAPTTALSGSGANVTIYQGDDPTPLATLYATPGYDGTIWNVVKITIDANKEVTITNIDTYSYAPVTSGFGRSLPGGNINLADPEFYRVLRNLPAKDYETVEPDQALTNVQTDALSSGEAVPLTGNDAAATAAPAESKAIAIPAAAEALTAAKDLSAAEDEPGVVTPAPVEQVQPTL
ncbi:MAG: M4 family metallopeptidase [Firmicutes bacterium]|nr:M4 family metallopeptidase [Bacillota bacterium]